MSKAILNRDVLDIIYEEICGYPIEDAYKILEDHRRGMYISTEWIEKYTKRNFPLENGEIILGFMADMLEAWEKENGKTN